MQILYKPETELEQFGDQVYQIVAKNFPQTFFVGGMVRDKILDRQITDIDIATEARPEQTTHELEQGGIEYSLNYAQFGVIVAHQDSMQIELTTLRKDLPSSNRYADVEFITDPEQDSWRRDFTINALYLEPTTGNVFDFHKGLDDVEKKIIRIIGNPNIRFTEDPLRIVRALRFSLQLQFTIEPITNYAVKHNAHLLTTVTKQRIQTEIFKIKDEKTRNELEKLINSLA